MISIRFTLTLACLFCFSAALLAQNSTLNGLISPTDDPHWWSVQPNARISAADFVAQQRQYLSLPPHYDLQWVGSRQSDDMTHLRYVQTYRQLPIEGAELLLHQKGNYLVSFNHYLVSHIDRSSTAALSEIDALEHALAATKASRFAWQNADLENLLRYTTSNPNATFYPVGQLVWVSPSFDQQGQGYRLAYKFDITTDVPASHKIYYIDATDGQVILALDQAHSCDGGTVCTAQSLFNNTVNINAYYNGDVYRLRNCESGNGIETFDANHTTEFLTNWVSSPTGEFSGDPTAVSAHWATEQTFRYFDQYHNCNSFDGNGAKILNWVHYGNQYSNAQWNGLWLVYGDGNPLYHRPFVSLDVVAHELTHAYTQHAANLIYAYEAGAINESFSDIFATVIDYYTTGTANWEIGEQVNTDGAPFRSLANPKQYQSPNTYGGEYWTDPTDCFAWSMSDYCGVHTNSGIQNYWFYLLANGGSGINDNGTPYSVSGVGIADAARLAYQMLYYLPANANYHDARQASRQAALALWGSNSLEYQSALAAWCAVGVGNCANNSLLLTAPGAQNPEQYEGGSTQQIHWVNNTNSATVALSYSTDGGLSWQYINPAAPNTGSYSWLVPNVNTLQALVKVQSTDNLGVMGISTYPFQITGCGTTAYFKIANTANSAIPDICQFESLEFENTSLGATHFEWYVNGQMVAASTNYNYTFNQSINSNWQTVTLVAYYNNDCTDQFTRYIYVNPQATAQFSYASSSNTDTEVSFYAVQDQFGANYTWTMGDGTTTNESNPTHLYAMAGSYEVCLTVSSTCSIDTRCQTISIAPTTDQPDVCAGNWINYTLTRNLRSIVQQSDSLLWVATSGGLVKYNPQTNARQVLTSADGMPGNSITALSLHDNTLWFGSNTSGFGKINNQQITLYQLPNELSNGNNSLPINDLTTTNDGSVWVAAYNNGLAKFDANNTWQHINNQNSSLPNNNIEQLAIDNDGQLWCISNSANANGWSVLSHQLANGTFTHYAFDGVSLPDVQSVDKLVIDAQNNKWILVNSGTSKMLLRFDTNTNSYTTERQGNLTAIARNPWGYVSVSAIGEPLYHYNGTNWVSQTDDVLYPSILFFDTAQNLWLGGEKLSRNLSGSSTWSEANISNPNNLPAAGLFNSIAINDATSNGNYQAAFATPNGVWVYNNHTFSTLNASYHTTAITTDLQGNLWFVANTANSNYASSIIKHQLDENGAATLVTYPISQSQLSISRMCMSNGVMWAAAKQGGLLRYDTATGEQQLYPLSTINNADNGIGISALTIDGQGNLWVGGSAGVGMFDGSEWHFYTDSNGYLAGFAPVTDLTVAPDGILWIATQHGLVSLDNDSWQYYTPQNSGLCHPQINRLSTDAYGNVYALTPEGVSRYDKQQTWRTFTVANSGLPANDLRQLVVDNTGSVFFAGSSGVGILQNTTGITPDFEPTTLLNCNPQSVIFENHTLAQTGDQVIFRWLVDGIEVASTEQLSYLFTTPGKHIVALIADNGICQNSISKAIRIYPNADMLHIDPQIVSCGTNTVLLDANIDRMASYSWLFNGNQIGTVRTMEVSQIGTYTLLVTDQCGATASASVAVSLDNDCVFPGDANYDGICNNYDVLSIARAFGTQGTARTTPSMQWDSWFSTDWNLYNTDGSNYKHADANGDGTVSRSDLQAIELNYGLTHGEQTPTNLSNNSPITLLPQGSSFEMNNGALTIDLSMANIVAPGSMVSGRAFAASIEVAITDANGQPFGGIRLDSARVRFGSEFGNTQNSWSITRFEPTSSNRGIVNIGYLHTDNNLDLVGRKASLDVYIEDEDSFPSIDSVLLAININYGSILNGNQLLPIGQYTTALLPPGNTTIVQAKALLQGCYNPQTDRMNTTLRNTNLLPAAQPYAVAPWNYAGAESVANANNIPINTVDWVLLEMRDATGTHIVEQHAAFLLNDGRIVDAYGLDNNGVRFRFLQNNTPYKLIVRHRNHLAIIGASVYVQDGNWNYDFSLMASQAQDSKQVAVGNGKYGMYAGDLNANGVISVTDYSKYLNQSGGINHYTDADCNLDRIVSVKDLNLYLPNASQIGVPEVRY